ncbi:hypothetical protein [Pseudonocardia kunmingensis]|uniref:DUF6841 domain-containing protein n=1 Tax=Pseudonocardia kunmingensis TaxID=630975 RepID=A0A543CYI8_9PSEU|nr:hypothetical protein [Pseudonocardia kunmingensis]TQM02145.1 hypothetical protein FB558_8007 [Pseudonocardia kunmingensis]
MDEDDVRRWFDSYLAEFSALGRGTTDDVRRILAYYAVPLLFSTDAGSVVLPDDVQVLAATQQQIDGMRAAGYDRSDELAAGIDVLNASGAVQRGRFARLRADGTEISRLEVTYLIADLPVGRRISAIIVHSAT